MFLPANITLQFGDSGDFVAELQRRLVAVKAHAEGGINGVFDGITVNSVSSFQSRVGIRADGIAGPETLRRLNGVISGDASAWGDNNHTAEEEAKQAAVRQQEALLRELDLAKQQQEVAAAAATKPVEQQVSEQPAATGPTPAQMVEAQLHQVQAQEQRQHAAAVVPPVPLNMGDMLAQMLMQQSASTAPVTPPQQEPVRPPVAQAVEQQPSLAQPHPATAPAQLSAGELLVQQLQQQAGQKIPQPALVEAVAKHQPIAEAQAPAAPAPKPPVAAEKAAAPAVQEEAVPRGLIGRAMQKMDAVMHRLTQHFETKLPPDVMREVERIGQIMAQSGVRESGVPSGPEPARSQAPARGPEQQQGSQRG